jgi:FixJ family two-component response regulator
LRYAEQIAEQIMDIPTVYVVDDDPAVLRAVAALLEVSGYRTQGFLSAREFLTQPQVPQEGCLVIDLTMPGIDGPVFMHLLRAFGSPIPVIMGSHGVRPADVQRWLQMGISAVLDKPFDAGDFFRAVQQAMNLSTYAKLCATLMAPEPAF